MPQIDRVSFTHEALINWMIENPDRALRDAAEWFGYSQSWLSTIIHSDAFQEQLRKRQDEMFIMAGLGVRKQLENAAHIAIEGLTRQLEKTEDKDFLLDASDKLLHRMGYAPASIRNPGGPNVQTNIQNNITVSASDLAAARLLITAEPTGFEAIEGSLQPDSLIEAIPVSSS